MGKPARPLGSLGRIKVSELGPKRHRARAEYRDQAGYTRTIERTRSSKTAATNALIEAHAEAAKVVHKGEVRRDHKIHVTAALWIAELEQDEATNEKAHRTVGLYKGYWKNWIKPSIGNLAWYELSVGACDRVIKNARTKKSYETASGVKTALGLLCGYATRHGALDANPVRSTKRLSRGDEEPKEIRALEENQRQDLLEKLDGFVGGKTVDSKNRSLGPRVQTWEDLKDLSRAFMATGGRISEMLAIFPEDVNLAEKTVALDYHVVRIKGVGLERKPNRKGGKGGLLLGMPPWSIPMWRRRILAAQPGSPVFASTTGGLLDPSNVGKRLAGVFDQIGYEWVTSHVLGRKTVAAVLDDAGFTNNEIADQLGNTPQVVERNYRRRRKANAKATKALGGMFEGSGSSLG